MKIVILLFLSLSSVLALAASIDQCVIQGEKLGDGRGSDFITPACLSEVIRISEFVSSDESYSVFGYKNLLVTKNLKSGEIKYISGTPSRLDSISGLSFDPKSMKALIFNSNTNYLLTFDVTNSGSIAPIYRFKLEDLEAPIKQIIQLPDSMMNALLLDNNSILFYRSKATEFAHRDESKTDILHKLIDRDGSIGDIRSISGGVKDQLILKTTKGKFSVDLKKLPSVIITKIL